MSDLKNTLMQAREEMLALRRRLAVAEAQVGVIDVFRQALAAQPPSQGYGIDVAWSLSKALDELEPQPDVSQDLAAADV